MAVYEKYVILMVSQPIRTDPVYYHKITTCQNIQRTLDIHNRVNGAGQSPTAMTRAGSPHWKVAVAMGPFVEGTTALKNRWNGKAAEVAANRSVTLDFIAKKVADAVRLDPAAAIEMNIEQT